MRIINRSIILKISIFFYVCRILILVSGSKTESEALLKLKESFNNAASLDSWIPGTEPCAKNGRWVGVLCANGVVSGLRLGRLGLSGRINVDALMPLPGLRSLAFMLNSFSGPIPEFHRMAALKGLYISGNQFTGEIPEDYFSKMDKLKKVWMSRNNFSGRVPSSLARLSQLMELHLDQNQFSGTIPPLEQKTLLSLNFSNNNLEGEIPSGLSRFSASAFAGNPGLCGWSSGRACAPPVIEPPKKDNRLVIIFWFIMGFASLLLVIVAVLCVLRIRKRRVGTTTVDGDRVKQPGQGDPVSEGSSRKSDGSSTRRGVGWGNARVGWSRKGSRRGNDLELVNNEKGLFGMADLMKAAAEVLGNGALGSSYKATMDSGLTVVVKRVKEMNKLGRDEFDFEMKKLGSLKHKNVLPPLAYYFRKDEKLLVHEYQHKRSLLFLLHGDRRVSPEEVKWATRLKIIQGIARGLEFIHSQLASLQLLPHGDLKSSNVLLSKDYEALLSDYGYCSVVSDAQAAHSLLAYKAPEAIHHNKISPKCDVYFLGIIILEILTRKFPSQYLNNEQGGTDVVQWVRSAIDEGREAELLDPDITNTTTCVEEMSRFLQIGAACTVDDPDERLDLFEAVNMIQTTIIVDKSDQETRMLHVHSLNQRSDKNN